jgi:hypothetical protein
VSDTEWELWKRNPITGERGEQTGFTMTAREVAVVLASLGYDVGRMSYVQVTRLGGRKPIDAESWLEQHPTEALIAAWTAGTDGAASHRQKALHDRWPALAMAIDNVQASWNADA